MGFSREEYWGGLPCPPPGDLPNPGIKPRSPALQADYLLSEQADFFIVWATREAQESLLQGNFLTQELNQSLLHCRQILYQLSYEESLSLLGTSSQLEVLDNCSFSWQMLLFFFFCTLVSGEGKPDWQLPMKTCQDGSGGEKRGRTATFPSRSTVHTSSLLGLRGNWVSPGVSC